MNSHHENQTCEIFRDNSEGSASVPMVAVAIHDGRSIRDELQPLLAISAEDRFREEDAFTSVWTHIAPTRVVATRSRFEVDFNRPRHRSVYLTPKDAWGLKVWQSALTTEAIEHSRKLYDAFYAQMRLLFDELAAQHGQFFVYDLHSYNHRRGGPEAPFDSPEDNPQINICTGGMDLDRCGVVVDRFEEALLSYNFLGGQLDVRRNVRFRATRFSRWVHENYPGVGISLALEISKFYMDEWTGEPDEQLMHEITSALAATVDPVSKSISSLTPRT